jgi:hypothetical protein
MYFTLTFDEETGHVLFEGLPTTKESIDEKRIVFTMQERDDSFGYVIDRMTGAMFVMNQRTGTSQNSSCKIAKKAFWGYVVSLKAGSKGRPDLDWKDVPNDGKAR